MCHLSNKMLILCLLTPKHLRGLSKHKDMYLSHILSLLANCVKNDPIYTHLIRSPLFKSFEYLNVSKYLGSNTQLEFILGI